MRQRIIIAILLSIPLLAGGLPAGAQGRCGPIDFVLVLDDTGSMSAPLQNIKTDVEGIVMELERSSGSDLQVALVTFKDVETLELGLTRDVDAFRSKLDKVAAGGGGGIPEASDLALATALGLPFRPLSTKIVVLVTDAPPGGIDGGFGPEDALHARQLAEQARGRSVLITALHIPRSLPAETRPIMEDYASITGGVFRELPLDGSGTAAAILESIRTCGGGTCARRLREQVLCATDGSGDFLYTFTFENLTDDDVRHVYLLQPPGGVTLTPNHVDLGIPARPGHARTVGPIRIQGAAPGQTISFTLSLHDETVAQCCSIPVEITLPTCDCAQVLGETKPSCFLPFTAAEPRRDRFVLQSLFEKPVQHVVLTPVSPEGVTLIPNHVDLGSNPLHHGESTQISVQIAGGKAGDRVCYLVSPHDSLFDECCSFERCVLLPDCTIELDDLHDFGDVATQGTDFGFLVEDFPAPDPAGDGGGIVIDTGGAATFDAEWAPIEADGLPPGAFLRQSFLAPVDESTEEPVAVLETLRVAEGIELRTSFPALGATRYTVELYRFGMLVDRFEDVPIDVPLRPIDFGPSLTTDTHYSSLGAPGHQPTPVTQSGGTSCDPQERLPGDPLCLFAGYTFERLSPWQFAFSAALADEVRVLPENGTGVVGPLEQVILAGGGLESLLIETIDVDFDCNANGVPDDVDVDLGLSLDLDRDGRLDECAAAAGAIVLNTGFDEAAGALLPPGAPDDDWTVVSPAGPARRVRSPNGGWAAPLANSAWISVDGTGGASNPGQPVYALRSCFCLGGGAAPVTLEGALFVDDRATVVLNGTPVAGPGGSYTSAGRLELRVTGALGDGIFQEGENCLVVEVDDSGGVVTGLDLVATVRAENPPCP
ncbi:MAG TPA: vWA domain-containing protein [Thermoanaerobaculia bacterium]|nr:vWA domain-containing protein [Thermoanaerobaculia bacterium]